MKTTSDATRSLVDGENVLRSARPHWTIFTGRMWVCGFTLVFGLVLVAATPGSAGNVSFQGLKLFLWLLINAILLALLAVRVVRWHYLLYALTDRHLILNSGVIVRSAEVVPLDRISDATLVQHSVARVFGCGDVAVRAPGRQGPVTLKWIQGPTEFLHELIDTIEARKHGGAPPFGPPRGPTGAAVAAPGETNLLETTELEVTKMSPRWASSRTTTWRRR